jgi:hypothetical protein
MSAFGGGFNRSTQHRLILLEEEVCDGGDYTDMIHGAAERAELWERWKNVNVWRLAIGMRAGPSDSDKATCLSSVVSVSDVSGASI